MKVNEDYCFFKIRRFQNVRGVCEHYPDRMVATASVTDQLLFGYSKSKKPIQTETPQTFTTTGNCRARHVRPRIPVFFKIQTENYLTDVFNMNICTLHLIVHISTNELCKGRPCIIRLSFVRAFSNDR